MGGHRPEASRGARRTARGQESRCPGGRGTQKTPGQTRLGSEHKLPQALQFCIPAWGPAPPPGTETPCRGAGRPQELPGTPTFSPHFPEGLLPLPPPGEGEVAARQGLRWGPRRASGFGGS